MKDGCLHEISTELHVYHLYQQWLLYKNNCWRKKKRLSSPSMACLAHIAKTIDFWSDIPRSWKIEWMFARRLSNTSNYRSDIHVHIQPHHLLVCRKKWLVINETVQTQTDATNAHRYVKILLLLSFVIVFKEIPQSHMHHLKYSWSNCQILYV